MKIVCDACQAKYSIADDKIQGKSFKIRCKKCNHIIVVKTGGESGAVASAAEKAKSGPVAAAPVATQGVWHIVVDGDQVGPLGDAEVKDRLRQGQINPDTLVWKEGFADWVKLSTVPELAAPAGRAAQGEPRRSATRESVRESVRSEAPAKVAAAPANADDVESDVFGAATVITPAGTADLFASAMAPTAVPTPVAPAPSSPFLFGGSSSQASEPLPVAAKSPGNGAGTSHLTGQRNENSVLFSLSNLEALAVPTQSAGIRAPSTTTTTEGSGLIDIRSMAAMTLNDGGGHDARRSSDSLPTFSTPQFSPVAPVLLPMSSSGPPKWVYPILGLLGVGVLVLGYGIFKVVTAPPPALPPPIVVPAAVPPPAPAIPPAATHAAPSVAPSAEGANPSQPEEKPTAEEKSAEKGKGGRSEKGHRKGGEQASSRSGADTKKGAETSASNPAHAPESASTAKPTGKKGGKSIDDMLGEVGNKKSGGDDASKPKPAAVNLISLTQSDIVNAMRAVQPRIQACANQFKVPGTAMASISVAAGGKVTSSTVTGKFAGTPTGTCVEAAAKSAKFPPCNSMSFPWPFTLSPR